MISHRHPPPTLCRQFILVKGPGNGIDMKRLAYTMGKRHIQELPRTINGTERPTDMSKHTSNQAIHGCLSWGPRLLFGYLSLIHSTQQTLCSLRDGEYHQCASSAETGPSGMSCAPPMMVISPTIDARVANWEDRWRCLVPFGLHGANLKAGLQISITWAANGFVPTWAPAGD